MTKKTFPEKRIETMDDFKREIFYDKCKQARQEERRKIGEWLDSHKEFINYHYRSIILHTTELEALKRGELPEGVE